MRCSNRRAPGHGRGPERAHSLQRHGAFPADKCTAIASRLLLQRAYRYRQQREGKNGRDIRREGRSPKINSRLFRLWGGQVIMRVTIMAVLLSVTVPLIVLAQTADELKHDDKTPGDVLTYGMGYSQQRF